MNNILEVLTYPVLAWLGITASASYMSALAFDICSDCAHASVSGTIQDRSGAVYSVFIGWFCYNLTIFASNDWTAYFPVSILYISIMSPLRRRYGRVRHFSLCKRSLYSRSLKLGINLLALYWTFLRIVICFIKKGLHIWSAYSRCECFIHLIESTSDYPHHQIGLINFSYIHANKLSNEWKVTPISFTLSVLVSVVWLLPNE